MVRRCFILLMIFCALLSVQGFCQGQQDEGGRLFVARDTQQHGYASAGIEAYLVGRALEVTVEARTVGGKAYIVNTFLAGPKLDRLAPLVNRFAFAGEREDVILARDKFEGTLSRKFYKFVIPEGKIVPGGDYQIRVIVEKQQNTLSSEKFSFKLIKLPELFLKQGQK
jgi:hypothetical protein